MKYDMALDCSLHFPSSAPLLWQAGIPYRIGFESAGLFPFLTTSHPWAPSNRSVLESYAELVGEPITYSLPSPGLSPIQGDYIVMHMGSGAPEKEWSIHLWRELAERLEREHLRLVFTGQGRAEKEDIASVSKHLTRAVDTSGALEWCEFVALIASARLLISLDTAAAHVAAATQTPALQLFSGNNPPLLWKPNSLLCKQVLLDESTLDQIFRLAVDIYSPTP